VFERAAVIPLHLTTAEADAVKSLADNQGIGEQELIRNWVVEKLRAS
jgi:hypothetical protein